MCKHRPIFNLEVADHLQLISDIIVNDELGQRFQGMSCTEYRFGSNLHNDHTGIFVCFHVIVFVRVLIQCRVVTLNVEHNNQMVTVVIVHLSVRWYFGEQLFTKPLLVRLPEVFMTYGVVQCIEFDLDWAQSSH